MKEISLLYTTHPDQESADRIALQLIEDKLAACTHVYAIDSCYRYEDKIQRQSEYMLRVKTLAELEEDTLQMMEESHGYDIPMIQKSRVQVNNSYYKWMLGVLGV